MATRLLLIRHGETADNLARKLTGWGDPPLMEQAIQRIHRLAQHLAGNFAITALYTSPLRRTLHTAWIIGDRLGLTPVVLEDLKEINFGNADGLTSEEIRERFPALYAAMMADGRNYSFTWPNGESRAQFLQRTRRVFAEIVGANPDRVVAVVAHGGSIALYLADGFAHNPNLWAHYAVDNCSVSEVDVGDGRLALIRHNDTSFLGKDDKPSP